MRIEFDPRKCARTMAERGLDFRDAELVFTGVEFTSEDLRRSYGETRYLTIGPLAGRLVVVAWTLRVADGVPVRRVFSMRKANERESAAYLEQFGES